MWFRGIESIEEAKSKYRELMKEHHPDHGGDTATAQEINESFASVCSKFMASAMDGDDRARNSSPTIFGEILAEAMKLNCRIEIIGFWIYAFESYEIRDRLKTLGFWFSAGHTAWVYSGREKVRVRSRSSTPEIRVLHGSKIVRERGELDEVEGTIA